MPRFRSRMRPAACRGAPIWFRNAASAWPRGTIIVGGSRGHDGAPELFLGDTLIVAEALLAAAEPGQSLLTEAIGRRLAGLFDIHECAAAAAAGFATHGKAFVVERELAGAIRFEARVGPTPLKMVGRDEELALLLGRWRRAKAGEGQAVLLVGEAGIGKSCIVRAMIDETAGESVRLISYQCTPNHRDTALWPIVTQLLAAAGFAGEDPDDQKLAKLARVLEEAGPEVMEAMPLIAALVGIGDADRQGIFAELPPQIRRARTLDTLVRYLIGLARSSPLLVVFEDIHWADPSTGDLLEQLIEAISGHAVLLLMTSRSSEQQGLVDHLHLAQLSISRLDRQGTTSIVREVAGAAQVPDAWLDAVFERADGIPLFIEELTKSFVEATVSAGRIRHAGAANPALPLAIPETLHDLLVARLDRLPIDKEVAQIAACIGREFSHELLTAAAEKPDAALQSTLDQLVASGLVFMRGTPPEASYLFKHALIRDAAYDSLLRKQRERLHARIAKVLEARFPDVVATQPELIAHHLAEGGQSARAIEFWMAAAHQALPRAAYREALTFVDHGLAAADAQADSPDMLAAAVDLRFLKYAAQFPLGEPQQIIKILAEAERKAFELNDPIRLCRVLSSQSYVLSSDGQVDDAIAVAQRGDALITENDDPHWFVMAKFMLARSLYAAGRYAEAIHQVTDTMDLLGEDIERGKRFPGFLNQTVSARAWLILFHAERGDFEAGERHGEDGLRLAQSALCGDHERLWVCNAIGRLNVVKADFGTAIKILEPILAVCENKFQVYISRVASSLGAAYAASGRLEDGLSLLRQADDHGRSIGFKFGRALVLAQLAEALLTAGKISQAGDKATEAVEIAHDAGERGNEGWAMWVLGNLASRSGQPGHAESHYRQALEIAETLEMAPLRIRCMEGLRRRTN